MRVDSPLFLALVGTLSVHVMLFTATDMVSTLTRRAPEPAPQFELIDIVEPDPPPPPPHRVAPPPVAPPELAHVDPVPPHPAPEHVHSTPARTEVPHHTADPTPDPAGPPGPGTGDGVDHGWADDPGVAGPRDAHGTRGGGGGGTGSGSGGGGDGAGSVPAAVAAPTIATIKKRALPRADYGVFEAGKDYPAEAKRLGIEGDLRVRLLVDTTGHVATTTLLGHLGHGLDELALQQARRIEFEPAIDTDDKPTASVVVWTFHFTLPR